MKTLNIIYTHGNEQPPFIPDFGDLLVANERAQKLGVRFIESDLNRSFGVKNPKTYEEKRAREIVRILRKYELVYDFHRTTAPHTVFTALITKEEDYRYVLPFLPQAVVLIDSPNSLIAHAQHGVALEYPRKFSGGGSIKPPLYRVEDYVQAGKNWRDFVPKKVGRKIMYPYLVGEKAYKGYCFLLRKIKVSEV